MRGTFSPQPGGGDGRGGPLCFRSRWIRRCAWDRVAGQGQLVIGQPLGPVAPQDAHRQVLVDDYHDGGAGSGVVGVAAAKERVGVRDGIEGGLELAY